MRFMTALGLTRKIVKRVISILHQSRANNQETAKNKVPLLFEDFLLTILVLMVMQRIR